MAAVYRSAVKLRRSDFISVDLRWHYGYGNNNTTVNFETSDPGVVTVTAGSVSFVGVGLALVTVIANGPVAECPSCSIEFYDYVTVRSKPTVQIGQIEVVPKGGQKNIEITLNPSALVNESVTLTLLTTEGNGGAQFVSSGSQIMQISQSGSVTLRGVEASSKTNNIRIKAEYGEDLLASKDFTVLWIELSLRTSGSVSFDNAGRSTYSSALGTANLGLLSSTGTAPNLWRTGVEIVGTVLPSDFASQVGLEREVTQSCTCHDMVQTGCMGPFSDNREQGFRDENPQSGSSAGKIYDLDAPGFGNVHTNPIGTIQRRRANFRQWAIFQGLKVSEDLFWFSRQSVRLTQSGDVVHLGVSGDNMAGIGITPTTCSLQ